MSRALPGWLINLGKSFREGGRQLYVVGGAIRDQLLHQPSKEWDLATDAKPEEIEKLLGQAKARKIGLIGKQFGTITAEIAGQRVEITTFRSDTYQETSRQPTVKFGRTIEEDLARRDFTINALALDLSGHLIDPWHGQADLEGKLVRCVGDPSARFHEDPLRMLRAARFATTLEFQVESRTIQAISDLKERFSLLSAERVAGEMDKILLANQPSRGIEYLVETGLIAYILPELIPAIDLEFDPRQHKDIYHHILQVLDRTAPKLELRWCALLHDIAKPLTRQKIGGEYHFLGHENLGGRLTREILGRLRYPNDFIKYVVKLVRLHQRLPGYDGSWADGGVRRFVRDASETLDDLFLFAEADSTGKNERKLALYRQNREKLKERIEELNQQAAIAKIKSPLSGDELMELFHRPPGRWIEPIKEKLLAMVLDGKLAPNDKDQAVELAREMIKTKE